MVTNQYQLLRSVLLDIQPYLSRTWFATYDTCIDKFASRVSAYGPDVFSECEAIPSGISTHSHRAHALLRKVLDKLEPPAGNKDADDAALELFLSTNERASRWSPRFLLADSGSNDIYGYYRQIVIGEMKNSLYKALACDDRTYIDGNMIKNHIDVGPGKSHGCDGFSLFSKVAFSELHATSSSARDVYLSLIRNSLWGMAEDHRASLFEPIKITPYNTLFFVPKKVTISRVAATEAGTNMVLQKAIGTCLENVLRIHYGLDIRHRQPLNQRLAQDGSLTGLFATEDLSSASDLVSVDLIKFLFPPNLVKWLLLARSTHTKIGTRKDGSVVLRKLNMIGTMGNGFTFPLMTLLFTALVRACYSVLGIDYIPNQDVSDSSTTANFSVFGDDIIVVSKAVPLVNYMLKSLGLQLNEKKSYSTGYFRESCGGDYLHGINVRPFFIRRIDTIQQKFIAFNGLLEWSSLHNMPLPRLSSMLLATIPKRDRNWVPRMSDPDSGIRVPEAYLPIRYHNARNSASNNLSRCWRYEVWSVVPFGEKVSATTVLTKATLNQVCFEGYSEVVWRDFVELSNYEKRYPAGGHKRHLTITFKKFSSFLEGNPFGYNLSVLRGDVREGFYATRKSSCEELHYVKSSATINSWDAGGSYFDVDAQRVFVMTLDQRLDQLGRSRQNKWKHLFDIYELNL